MFQKPVHRQALYMLASVMLFSLNDALNKIFVADIRPQEILLWRSGFEVILLLGLLFWMNPKVPYGEKVKGLFNTPYLKLHVLRVALGLSAIWLEIYALKFLPLSSFAFIYAFNPLIVILLACLFLKEKPQPRLWFLVACGVTSALITAYTHGHDPFTGASWAILAMVLYAFCVLFTKKCSEDGPLRTLFLYSFMALFPCAIACQGHLEAHDMQIVYFIGQAFLHLGAFYTFVKALSLGDVSRVSPLEYTDILWAAFFGFLLFKEVPMLIFWVAAAILTLGKIFYFQGTQNKVKKG